MSWEDRLSETAKAAKASDIRELLKLTAQPGMISFAGGLPDPNLFPINEYEEALARVMELHGPAALQYGMTEGLTSLRTQLVQHLIDEGITCPETIENVILTTGSQQALDLLGLLLLDPGDTVLVEGPSYLGALQAFSLRQPNFEAVEMDASGLRIDLLADRIADLKRAGRPAKFLYTIPTFQNPTGITMTLERRQQLVKLALREDLLIIEDDPYGRLRFRGEALPSLKSLDACDMVISLRTFSKTLAPALRTGYVVGPPNLLRRLVILKQAADLCSPTLNHYVIAEMLQNGAMERYIQHVIKVYGHKETMMAAALEAHLGQTGTRWTEPDGGMFFWLELPDGLDSGALLAQALEVGVAYVKGVAFYSDGVSGSNCLRLNFSQPNVSQIESGIARLATIIKASLAKKYQ